MLSAVVTCSKCAQAIPLMHARLTRVSTNLGVKHELSFVNDGSPDDSNAVLRDHAGVGLDEFLQRRSQYTASQRLPIARADGKEG
jgi:hypothetical protein